MNLGSAPNPWATLRSTITVPKPWAQGDLTAGPPDSVQVS